LFLLLAEHTRWHWGDEQQAAFDTLRQKLMTSPVLCLPVPDRPFTLSTDFSSEALSAVLEQLQADSKLHVVAYTSRCCSDAEGRLCSSEGECLALLFGIKKFHHYLAGAKFTVVTDNTALQYLESCKGNSPKLTR